MAGLTAVVVLPLVVGTVALRRPPWSPVLDLAMTELRVRDVGGAHSPLIGRKVKGGERELVIGRSSRGYVALYRFLPDIDTVFILALRSQREGGYQREG